MNNEQKITTSIQYQMSNVVLFNEIYNDWSKFNEVLNRGPEEMKKYLFNMWNILKEDLKNNPRLTIVDYGKKVDISDFDVTYNRTKNGTSVFFFTFPDHNIIDASSKYVALALTPNMPRYFTLEYSDTFDGKPCWVMGEFFIQNSQKGHANFGTTDNMRLTWFAGYIINKLESENL